jgi:hypothetical protein
MGITADLARFTADIRLDRLPLDVVRRAHFLVLDLAGPKSARVGTMTLIPVLLLLLVYGGALAMLAPFSG